MIDTLDDAASDFFDVGRVSQPRALLKIRDESPFDEHSGHLRIADDHEIGFLDAPRMGRCPPDDSGEYRVRQLTGRYGSRFIVRPVAEEHLNTLC